MKAGRTAAVMVLVAVLWIAGQTLTGLGRPDTSSATPSPATSSKTASGGHTTARELDELLGRVRVVADRRSQAGYDRDCGTGHACSFGPAWTDDYDGPGGHDGCDTRNNVLRRDLSALQAREGTHGCVIVSGELSDPYTGARIQFRKQAASKVQVDHIYPLAAAWDMGAARWPLERRIRFANDVDRNLLAVDGSANASKGDRTPGEWMPLNRAYACSYVARFLRAAISYDLPITRSDAASVRAARKTCPTSSASGKVQP